MPTVKWNKNVWNKKYNWELKGEEWSQCWGSSEAQWFSSLYPRIHRFIGCDNILEIACGYGRWTNFLQKYAIKNFKGIDLSSKCIEYCKQHLSNSSSSFHLNNGLSLNDVSDIKYDFIFSFDSMIHVNPKVLQNYIKQIIPLLNTNGVCFIHHSNFGPLVESGGLESNHKGYVHFRDQKTSAKIVYDYVYQGGGKILCQEIIDWGGGESIDCLTTFCNKDSFPNSKPKQIINKSFMAEANIIQSVHSKYCDF